jgi:hypothetical protein
MGKTEERNSKSTLPSLRDAVLVLTIYVFFAGFIYQYFYFSYLGIPINSISVPYNATLIYAFSVGIKSFWWALILLTVVLVVQSLIVANQKIAGLYQKTRMQLLIFTAVISFPVVFVAANYAARVSSREIQLGTNDTITRVSLSIKPERRKSYPPLFLRAVDNDAAYLLATASDGIYVLVRQAQLPESKNLSDSFLYSVPIADIAHYRTVVPGCTACIGAGK